MQMNRGSGSYRLVLEFDLLEHLLKLEFRCTVHSVTGTAAQTDCSSQDCRQGLWYWPNVPTEILSVTMNICSRFQLRSCDSDIRSSCDVFGQYTVEIT